MKQWMMKKNPADLKKIAERYHISEILAEVLVKRGLYDWNAIDDYLYPSMDKSCIPPMTFMIWICLWIL